MYPLAFALLFNIRAFWLAVTGLCRTANAGPYFAPLLSPLYAWTLAIFGTITTVADPTGIPASVAVLITWAGPVSLTAISCLTFPSVRKRPEERTLRLAAEKLNPKRGRQMQTCVADLGTPTRGACVW